MAATTAHHRDDHRHDHGHGNHDHDDHGIVLDAHCSIFSMTCVVLCFGSRAAIGRRSYFVSIVFVWCLFGISLIFDAHGIIFSM